jgi:hypothetical protein
MLQTTAFAKLISECLTEETKWQNRVHSYVTVSRGRAKGRRGVSTDTVKRGPDARGTQR